VPAPALEKYKKNCAESLDTLRPHLTIPANTSLVRCQRSEERVGLLGEKLKPGMKTPESGIYRPTKGGTKIAVSKDDRLPPTKPGGGWTLVTPTKK
jgi:hypothetical protein